VQQKLDQACVTAHELPMPMPMPMGFGEVKFLVGSNELTPASRAVVDPGEECINFRRGRYRCISTPKNHHHR